MEALGMCRIVVEDGKVTEVGEPRLKYCPLFNKLLGVEDIDSEAVRKNLEYRVKSFGFGTEVEVLSPESVRRSIRQQAEKLLQLYGESP